jgi:hypothetical protein
MVGFDISSVGLPDSAIRVVPTVGYAQVRNAKFTVGRNGKEGVKV